MALFAILLAGALATNAPGWYVADNRFEHYWSPGRVLSRLPFLWDASRGLGRPRGEFAPVSGSVLALLRGFQASPAVAERLWHAILLITAGTGVVMLLRVFRPGLGPEHVVAGLFYVFNPYSAVFLVPSGLFLNYAIAPWLLVSFVRGSCEDRPWRWAAIFALLILASGGTDPPGLFYALLLIIPTALYLALAGPGVGWARIAGWLGRAALLSIVVSAATLAQVVYGSTSLSARLLGTESVEVVQSTTSWAEVWRGLGFWVSYFPDGDRLLRQEHAAYFASAPVILATFLPPCVALATIGWCRWRPRLLMAALVLLSATLMVGSYPPNSPSPFGRLLLDVYQRVPELTALRTSYKAGAGLAMGVACLLGVGVAAAVDRLAARRRGMRAAPVGAAVVVIAVVSFPFWTARLYSPENRMRSLPEYWTAAIGWLDRQPDHTRALVIPGTSNSRYRWGSPGDDIFDALLARPHVLHTSLPLETAQAFNLVESIDDRVGSGRYEPGTLGPIARRLGIGYVVIRNDLDWQRLQRPRPSTFDALRRDPDLQIVATFGRPGQNVLDPGDGSRRARAEANLAPVEVFRVEDAAPPARVVPAAPPLLVSGDGDAWFQLAAQDLLDGPAAVRYTADATPRALGRLLRDGARVVVTDTNRRRVTVVTRFGQIESHTLAAGENLERPANDLFGRPASQTVAAFGDAEKITSSATGRSPSGFEPWLRPANAFDGDEDTSWLTGGYEDPVGESVKAQLEEPIEISAVDVAAARPSEPGRTVSAASVGFSDGSTIPVDLTAGRARVTFAPRRTASLEVRIDAVVGDGQAPVGFSEVSVRGLDLVEALQVPDDLFEAAEKDAALREHLATAPVGYLFERVRGDGPSEAEVAMRRRFRSLGDRSYRLDGMLALGPHTRDEIVDPMVGAPVGAYDTPCVEELLTVDGERVPFLTVDGEPVPLRVGGSVDDLVAGRPVPYSGCRPVDLDSGWHRLDTISAVTVESANLTAGPPPREQTARVKPRADVVARDPSRLRLRVQAPDGGVVVVSGQSYDPQWTATADGEDLGAAQPMDTQSAWVIPEEGTYLVDLWYRPQRIYDLALVLTASSVALCAWLAVARRREP